MKKHYTSLITWMLIFIIEILLIFGLFTLLASCSSRNVNLEKIKTETEQSQNIDNKQIVQKSEETNLLQNSQEKQLQNIDIQKDAEKAEEQTEISVKGAAGNVKFTDKKGNQWEIPSNENTEISAKALSKLEKENENLKFANEIWQEEYKHLYSVCENLVTENYKLKTETKTQFSENQKLTERKSLDWKLIFALAIIAVFAGVLLYKLKKR